MSGRACKAEAHKAEAHPSSQHPSNNLSIKNLDNTVDDECLQMVFAQFEIITYN